jgi:Flp pilus assembly protein TadD
LAGALALHQSGRPWRAIAVYRALLQQNPHNPDVLHLLGVALHQVGQSERSPDLIRAAIALRPDAQEYHNNLGIVLRDLGRFREALEAFEEASRLHPGHIEANLNIARILSGQGRPLEALKRIETIGVQVPFWVEYWVTRGRAERLLGEIASARRSLDRALVVGPDRAEAWLQRGATRLAGDDWSGGRDDLRRALCLKPALHEAMSFLGYRELTRTRLERADRLFRLALIVSDGDVSAHIGRAEVAYGRDDAASAADLARAAVQRYRTDAHHRFRHGIHLLAAGETEAGWAEYDHIYQRGDSVRRIGLPPRWRAEDQLASPDQKPGHDLADRRILICAEQGVGDELLFTAHMPQLVKAAGEVILECDPRVLPLFRRSFPSVFVHAYSRRRDRRGSAQSYDWIPRGRAPDLYAEAGLAFSRWHRSVEDADRNAGPWLVPDPSRAAEMRAWLETLPPGPRVGVSWRSMAITELRAPHYPDLEGIRPILEAENVQFVALQYGDGWREALAASGLPVHVVPGLDTTDDIDGVVALASELDLMIGPSCTLNWIAAGVGLPMWMLYNHPTFLNFGTDRFPGFPTLRGFSKRIDEDWDAPVAALCEALAQYTADTVC